MDDPLQGLIRELRSERCPAEVQDRVADRLRRADANAAARGRVVAWGLAGAALLAVALVGWEAVRRWTPRPEVPVRIASLEPVDRALVLAQAQGAFVVIGRILIDAGVHAEGVLLKEAVPPLVDGFLSAKNKLTPTP